MAGNRTFTMIKPDAVESNNIGNIIQMISNAGFTIKAMKFTKLSHEQAKNFYEVARGPPSVISFCFASGSVLRLKKKSIKNRD